MNPPVFFSSALLLILLLVSSSIMPEKVITLFKNIQGMILTNYSWFYILSVGIFLVFALWLAFGPFASLRLGADDEKPEYSRASWYAMLFAAGMGIGLVFYGVAEPMRHYMSPPTGAGMTAHAYAHALPLTYHHWGFHAWAIYAVVGLCIAYSTYRKGLPLNLCSSFYPIFGDRIYGWVGHSIDILAVFGTLFGLATSLGAGATSVSAGLARVFGTPNTVNTHLIVIAFITLAATISLVTGVDKGIKRLSEANMVIASILLFFILICGPTTTILNTFVESFGSYLRDFVDRSFRIGYTNTGEKEWIAGWSVVYWGWWIAWAPFVGIFVARISRGRTIRDFVLSILTVPVMVTFFWFAVFGGTALHNGASIAEIMQNSENYSQADAVAVYAMLEQLPMSSVLSFITVIVVMIFFISSSDSASYVVDMLTSGGLHEPPVWQRIFWATSEGATAGILLYIGGDKVLSGLKAGVVSFGLPFCALIFLMCYSLYKSLSEEGKPSTDTSSAKN